ncbi:(R,R)-butanediol dehydrogenase/meso-butanediol dehydrogenase/diacetyl reductase [Branchiibius hedensis]|uniref:(R,R)-butanediol dehydrogenase / meso-butanediol dehydrogenase / diacetyl reductase n=1 Tax=Branchiibius hedensis TaxID=672460 RepID=A0A2Y8ZMN7_9MICO|nr:2,3-butanediol dehydrogenase [Branchiibius hedensis]PWJ24865.1 (R,R)-butanediol dehydrogenase/meso-butanediol dehydrogenase/diacetyl reductase [Branchiibius hedensis]SSA33681.1 (R,R)-butanediol dehydrogenase / meso-butanediol dehydrogenase / diacetyl reductase [Branchiibius hedensis]
MRAAVYYGNSKVEIEDVPEPDVTDGHVKVKVAFNGICGTDLHEYYDGPIFISPSDPHPLTGMAMPVVLGHEFSGTVVAVGKGVTDVAEGDRVTIEPVYRCGECRACQAGQYNVCNVVGFHGLMADGGMAEYTVVPRIMIHHLPQNVSTELGALAEPMSVAYHAAALGGVTQESRALIYGAGPIGIGLWFALRGMGLTEIEVVEPTPTRRAAIETLGARTLDPSAIDVAAYIADQTNGAGVDAAYDAAGVAPAVSSALDCLGERRTLVSVAIYDKPIETPLLSLVLKERRIQGTICYTADDYRAVLDLMEAGHYDTTGWVETIPISGLLDQGFAQLRAGQKMKVLVDPTA